MSGMLQDLRVLITEADEFMGPCVVRHVCSARRPGHCKPRAHDRTVCGTSRGGEGR